MDVQQGGLLSIVCFAINFLQYRILEHILVDILNKLLTINKSDKPTLKTLKPHAHTHARKHTHTRMHETHTRTRAHKHTRLKSL